MNFRHVILLLGLFFPPAVLGQNLSIHSTVSKSEYSLVKLELTGVQTKVVEWDIVFDKDISAVVKGKIISNGQCEFMALPGTYRVTAWAAVEGSLVHATTNITVGGHVPPKPPDPLNPPFVMDGPLELIGIFDSAALATLPQGQRDIHTSATIKDLLSKLNCTWRNYDKDAPALQTIAWTSIIGDSKFPLLLIVNGRNNTLLKKVSMPLSEKSIFDLVVTEINRSRQ